MITNAPMLRMTNQILYVVYDEVAKVQDSWGFCLIGWFEGIFLRLKAMQGLVDSLEGEMFDPPSL